MISASPTTAAATIALHTSVGLAERFGPEHCLSYLGISLDINGADKDQLGVGFADRVHAAFPRHDLGYAIAEAIACDTQSNRRKAPPVHLSRAHPPADQRTIDDVLRRGGGLRVG